MDLEQQIQLIQRKQRQKSLTIGSGHLSERLSRLEQLKKLLLENEERWLKALRLDLHKPAVESYSSELAVLLNEIDHTKQSLKRWLKPKKTRRYLLSGIEQSTIYSRPFGSILVISPWNYPLQLALMPVIGALAAGNSCVLKPSEFTPNVSQLLLELIPKYFEHDTLFVVQGDSHVGERLTKLKWDFVVFTGSYETGQKLYKASADYVTPVLLELGGKNPCVLDEEALTENNIKKIIWGKFLNAGQSCIAPDTVYVPDSIYEETLIMMKRMILEFYTANPQNSPDFGRLVHEKHFNKVASFLKDGQIYHGGTTDQSSLYIEPTILVDLEPNTPARNQEIFGPVVPVVPYSSLTELVEELKNNPVPLVSYLFSKNKQWIEYFEKSVESGSLSINDVIIHAASPNIPFGGKGVSGIGRYDGKSSFDLFTYEKTIFKRFSPIQFQEQFPPYTERGLRVLRKLRRKLF